MANESKAQLHVQKNRILTSQLLVPVSLNGSGAKLQHSSQKRNKNTPRKRKSKWGGKGVRIEKYGPQSSKSIVKPGMAHTGLVLERSTRSTKETESSKPNWDMKQDGLKLLRNKLVIWLSVCRYLPPSLT